MNRETWLEQAVLELDAAFFAPRKLEMPAQLRVSCGFPRGSATAIGQCWDPTACPDGTIQVFICPSLAEPMRVVATLLHELVHAVVGVEHKHHGPFAKLAREIGLAGKLTATYVKEGSELEQQLLPLLERLGNYPHAGMIKRQRSGTGGNGWQRWRSVTLNEYTVVANPRMVELYGVPCDPWGTPMELIRR